MPVTAFFQSICNGVCDFVGLRLPSAYPEYLAARFDIPFAKWDIPSPTAGILVPLFSSKRGADIGSVSRWVQKKNAAAIWMMVPRGPHTGRGMRGYSDRKPYVSRSGEEIRRSCSPIALATGCIRQQLRQKKDDSGSKGSNRLL